MRGGGCRIASYLEQMHINRSLRFCSFGGAHQFAHVGCFLHKANSLSPAVGLRNPRIPALFLSSCSGGNPRPVIIRDVQLTSSLQLRTMRLCRSGQKDSTTNYTRAQTHPNSAKSFVSFAHVCDFSHGFLCLWSKLILSLLNSLCQRLDDNRQICRSEAMAPLVCMHLFAINSIWPFFPTQLSFAHSRVFADRTTWSHWSGCPGE
jgi:hypothetical protein